MPADVVDWVREKASGSGRAVSALLTALVVEARSVELQRDARLGALDALLAEHLGEPLTEAELEQGEAELRKVGLV